MLQELLAAAVGARVGTLYQFSNNLHVYRNLNQLAALWDAKIDDKYADGLVEPRPILTPAEDAASWLEDAERFCSGGRGVGYATDFFPAVAVPMLASWRERRAGKNDGREALRHCGAEDWRVAAEEWIGRNDRKKEAA